MSELEKLQEPTEQEIQELKDFFQFEYCHECKGDWYDHYIMEILGNPFYLCKTALFENYKVNQGWKGNQG